MPKPYEYLRHQNWLSIPSQKCNAKYFVIWIRIKRKPMQNNKKTICNRCFFGNPLVDNTPSRVSICDILGFHWMHLIFLFSCHRVCDCAFYFISLWPFFYLCLQSFVPFVFLRLFKPRFQFAQPHSVCIVIFVAA